MCSKLYVYFVFFEYRYNKDNVDDAASLFLLLLLLSSYDNDASISGSGIGQIGLYKEIQLYFTISQGICRIRKEERL